MQALLSNPRFQAWVARTPLLRRIARRDGAALFDLIAGFAKSQILLALVELDVLEMLRRAPCNERAITQKVGLAPEQAALLLNAGVAIRMLEKRGDRFRLSRQGAAFLGVPGLVSMVRHHSVMYRDLRDPVALLRGEVDTELSAFWPYVFGAARVDDPDVAARYSKLMADSQILVSQEILSHYRFSGVKSLMDIGGGTGAFLRAVGRAHPDIKLSLLDLPHVVEKAPALFAEHGLEVEIHGQSFRDAALPGGADAISLVRVLYDHGDETVAGLLHNVHTALPPGGRVIIAEPMTGGDSPHVAGDVYFATYCLAMQTGRARSMAQISDLVRQAGFEDLQEISTFRPFIASILTATKSDRKD